MAGSVDENNTSGGKGQLTSEELITKLRTALQKDGDFPASAKVVSELRMLTSNPKTTANQITEIILREPSLGTRVLHLVNSSFYRRAKPIMTVSQAVVQIGMRPLAEMCAGLILLQKFVPAARQGGVFANCLQKTILTSLLSSLITTEQAGRSGAKSTANETGYLAGSFFELGTLLLAFYFPKIYETAVKRAQAKRLDIGTSIAEITGVTPLQLSMEVIDALQLPAFYKDVLLGAEASESQNPNNVPHGSLSNALRAAKDVSGVLVYSKSKAELDAAIKKASARAGIDLGGFQKVVGDLPNAFKDHCSSIEVALPALPEYVKSYSKAASSGGADGGDSGIDFSQFIEEVKQAVDNREPVSSVITTVMETLAWGMEFDRVLLLLVSHAKRKLSGRMLLGKVDGFDPRTYTRPLGSDADPHAPDAQACAQSRPIFSGDPLFEDGWPLAAIPIGLGQQLIGVIYADRVGGAVDELSAQEQAAIGVLAELLDRSINSNS